MRTLKLTAVVAALGVVLGLPAIAAAGENPTATPTATATATAAPTSTATPTAAPSAAATPTAQPTPQVCDEMFPDTVLVGQVFHFDETFLDLEDPAPYLLFTSDDGREFVATGFPSPDLYYELPVEITDEWVGHWNATWYNRQPGAPPCVDEFTVVAAGASPRATPTPTLPASTTSSAVAQPGRASLAAVMLVVAAVVAAVALSLARARRNTR